MEFRVVAINKKDMSSYTLMAFKTLKEAQNLQKSLIEGKDPVDPLMYAIDSYFPTQTMTVKKS